MPWSQAVAMRTRLGVPAAAKAHAHHKHERIRVITTGRATEDESLILQRREEGRL